MKDTPKKLKRREIPFIAAVAPVAILFCLLTAVIIFKGPVAVTELSPFTLLASAASALIISLCLGTIRRRRMRVGFKRAATQVLPAIPLLIFIALLATSWMMAGVVPAMVTYGMDMLNPHWFLAVTCLVSAVVSVMTGSSWSTIATIGVAFIGIGDMMGHSSAWTAGAVISGAYFGDKVSPLSDTTVIASSTCEVDIFDHIKYMMITTTPAMLIALVIFGLKGFFGESFNDAETSPLSAELGRIFNLSPWLLVIPAATVIMIALRVPTLVTLGLSSLAGVVTALIVQPQFFAGHGFFGKLGKSALDLLSGFSVDTGSETADALISTGGVAGILPVVFLVLSALVFGWVMIGTGMLGTLTERLTRGLRRPVSIVSASIASGFTLSACTADQYLSIIIGGNMYRRLYRKHRLENRLLSRSLEDSVSATSPIIPWSSCGVTQSAVLGVSTFAYLPYCFFNYLTPLFGIAVAALGWKIRRTN
ncbi:MAG: sodium:proton antiporter [Bacteroides sp.]|nr:sodium:proton antiporter [Bacteroides sp.]